MARKSFKYGALDVNVSDVGTGTAPWDPDQSPRPEYTVTVKRGDTVFKTKAWGSIDDYQKGVLDHRGMAQMVVADLSGAYADPEEYFELVIGEAKGRDAYDRGKVAEALVRKAEEFGAVLERAGDKAREEEEGDV